MSHKLSEAVKLVAKESLPRGKKSRRLEEQENRIIKLEKEKTRRVQYQTTTRLREQKTITIEEYTNRRLKSRRPEEQKNNRREELPSCDHKLEKCQKHRLGAVQLSLEFNNLVGHVTPDPCPPQVSDGALGNNNRKQQIECRSFDIAGS